eukprot:5600402-Alexandrium_andersonii.AAC.1
MSASLVGSEMCIRDRSGGAWRTGALAGEAARAEGASLAGPGWAAAPPGAVSYTHLTLPTNA